MKKFRIVFFGTDDFSAPSLRELLKMPEIEVVAAVTKPDAVKNRGRQVESPLVANIAREYNSRNSQSDEVKIFQPTKLHDIEAELRELQPDAGVLVAYGKIIPQSTIDIFAKGIINFHPSLLPKLRGPSPIETAILNGEPETGLTLMKLVREMDTGPILYQEKVNLSGRETAPELREKFAKCGAELLREKLPETLEGEVREIAQNDSLATYCKLLEKSDGQIDPKNETAPEIDRKIRAFLGWPKTRLDYFGREIIVTTANVLGGFAGDEWPDVIKCADDTYLQIAKIISPKTGKEITMSEYLHGRH